MGLGKEVWKLAGVFWLLLETLGKVPKERDELRCKLPGLQIAWKERMVSYL
jgi:hypothetical protein